MTKISIKQTVEVDVKFLKADCGVRYWEDAEVNGIEDDETNPAMPFASKDSWRPIIDIEAGVIVDWPKGITADTHYKVCDAGVYTLLDADRNEVKQIDGYVPSIMCPEGGGYGDYVIMKIDADGKIANWSIDLSEFERDGE
ncbi:hypothetical protein O9X81_05430 [Agrobacterium salinitolerans]|uniref:hypothetical protein n=1 Tax=Agrobacterium salinitolerans TaxID=1183413 RepID=UPI0022B8291F|nr:hypothetical protein [Agrobacterium salinitolerans]MCZ7856048.1 hypothetical protein [Agrobacterium salinitolerans]